MGNRKLSLKVFGLVLVVLSLCLVPSAFFENTLHVLLLGMWPHDLTDSLYRSPLLSVAWIESPARLDLQYLPKYDIIIIHDVPSGFLSNEFQLMLISQIEAGKGLVLFGGPFSFGSGSYQTSQLSAILPINCESNDFRDEKAALNGTLNHQILNNVQVSDLAVHKFNVLTPSPGSCVLAVDYYSKLPMIVIGEHGKGKIAVLAFAGILSGKSSFDQLLHNLVEWLAPQSISEAEFGLILIEVLLSATVMAIPLYLVRRRIAK